MRYRSSRSRRREEPHRAEGHFQFQKWPNASRVAFDSACDTGFSPEEDSFALEIRQNSSKKASGIPTKELMDEQVSKEKEIRCASPSLIARLMGLDTLPSSVRQQKNIDGYCQTASSIDILGNYLHAEDYSYQRRTNVDQEFKDVFEVMETSKIMKHRNHSNSRRMLNCRGNGAEMDLLRQKYMDTKRLSTREVLQNVKEFSDSFEIPYSSKDIFLEQLQDPSSLFTKHFQHLDHALPSSHRNKITILKPCKGTKHWSNEVWSKSCQSARKPDGCFHMQQEITDSFKMHAASLDKHSVREKSDSLLHNSSVLQHLNTTETCAHPACIVILKPGLEKAQKIEGNLFTHESFWSKSKKFREIAVSGIHKLHDEGRQKFSHHSEVLSRKGSTEIARKISRKMKHTISSRNRKNFTSGMNPYAGNEELSILSGITKLNHSEAIYPSPDHFGERSNSFSPSSSYSIESSMSMEARKRLSERWKITHQFENRGPKSRGSSTLGELLGLSDRVTSKVSADTFTTKNVSDEKWTNNEAFGRKGHPSDIRSKNVVKDESSKFKPRSNSLPDSCTIYGSPKLSDGNQDGRSSNTIFKDVQDIGPSDSSYAKFIKPGIVPVRSSEHHTHKFRLAYSVEEENMLPEWEIHVRSEGLRTSIHEKNYLDKELLHPAPIDYACTDRNQLKTSASVSILGDVSWHLTTQEEQAMQSAFEVPSEDEGLFGRIQNDPVIEEMSSDHPQVEWLPSESDVAESHPPSFEELEQPSPVSVLETPSEDETYSSGCFERLSADLKELRMKLQLLKLESVDTYTDETPDLAPSNEDCAGDNHVLWPLGEMHQGFKDSDDRDFTYLLEILVESGVHAVDNNKLSDACYLLSHPVDQNVFNKLEKKYDRIASWSRSERKLLFDLINCSLAGLVTACMDMHPPLTSKIFPRAWDREGLVEALWQMVVNERKELDHYQQNKVLEQGWLGLEQGIDLIGREIEGLLNDELLDELLSEFVPAS